jgi:hypothetical protein
LVDDHFSAFAALDDHNLSCFPLFHGPNWGYLGTSGGHDGEKMIGKNKCQRHQTSSDEYICIYNI